MDYVATLHMADVKYMRNLHNGIQSPGLCRETLHMADVKYMHNVNTGIQSPGLCPTSLPG